MDTKDKRLEKIAEELMGSRKWKQYQDSVEENYSAEFQIDSKNCANKKEEETEENKNKIDKEEEIVERMTIGGENNCEILDQEKISNKKIDNKNSPSIADSQALEPVDWEPQDKCYFCVDGSIAKSNETGEIADHSESELNKHIIESEDSSLGSDTLQQQKLPTASNFIPKQLELLLKNIIPDTKMTSLESMAAAQLAAFQRLQAVPDLNQLNPLYSSLLLQQLQQHMSPSTTPDRTSSPSTNKSIGSIDLPQSSPNNSATVGVGGEQPLDLSAKPSGSMDQKNVFKAKPRLSTLPNRRAYTEEELNNALQDILSGKLGTRRAAVLYGIPRSTLRNKVYKLAIEQKRELLANNPPIAVLEGEEDDKDSDPEDDKVKNPNFQLQNYWKLMENAFHVNNEQQQQQQQQNKPQSWPMDAAAMLQNLLLANTGGMSGAFPPMMQTSAKEDLPDFLRHLLTQSQELKSSQQADVNDKNERNGSPSNLDRLQMLNLLQQQFGNKSPATPNIEMDANDDSSILKVPSVKSSNHFGSGVTTPSSSGQSRNGDIQSSSPSTSPQIGGRSVLSASPSSGQQTPILASHINMLSAASQRRDSSSPPTAKFNLHDVIRQSISKNFQSSHDDIHKHSTPLSIDPMMDSFNKRPTISVIKNLGGTDISRFGSNPNVTQINPQLSPNNTGTGGKGTRPKRGKYRNYDRDSLVEAVKAVQRGEMSVHRAGSYYGVPHSTLEYKVKERHLMRPRKREPKPQPGLDSASSSVSSKPSDISGIRVGDKSKVVAGGSQNQKPLMKSSFQNTNGMKIPSFLDPSVAAQLQYTSQLFWQNPANFPQLGLDFARQAQGNPVPFPPNSENFFTQQMLQKIHEEQQQQMKNSVNGKSSHGSGSDFEGSSTNGASFLDGIIRQSLDKSKTNEVHSTLFEQLLKTTKRSLASTSFEESDFLAAMAKKRTESPLDLLSQHHGDIKKERSTPSPEKLMKMSDEMAARYENSREELNGSLKNEPSDEKNSDS